VRHVLTKFGFQGHEVIRDLRRHRSKHGQVFFEVVDTDLYRNDFNAIAASDGIRGVLFRLDLRSWGGDL